MYAFSDYDDEKCLDLSVTGEEYAELINTCFRYSTHFSFNIGFLCRGGIPVDIPQPYKIYKKLDHFAICDDIAVLPCTETTREYLLNRTNDLFEWIDWYNNPEDLTFYRQDGSMFFWSLIHEGECCLIDRPEEDVSAIVKNPYWYKKTPEDGFIGREIGYIGPNGIAIDAFRLMLPDE